MQAISTTSGFVAGGQLPLNFGLSGNRKKFIFSSENFRQTMQNLGPKNAHFGVKIIAFITVGKLRPPAPANFFQPTMPL